MSAAIEEQEHGHFESALKTTRTDQYSSLLFALIIMFGVGVLMLGALYIMNMPRSKPADRIIVDMIPEGTENPPGLEMDSEPPAPEEVEEMSEPTLDETLNNISDAISAALDVGKNQGTGKGDKRRQGPPGNADIVPRYERWELKFTARDIKGYGQLLDFFNIELAAVGGGKPLVDYASSFSSQPKSRSGRGDAEKRLYFMYRAEGPLLQYDRQLLKQGGVAVEGRTVLKFLTPELENQLANLEYDYMVEKLNITDPPEIAALSIAKTVFESQPAGKEFRWVVIDQRYRKSKTAPPSK